MKARILLFLLIVSVSACKKDDGGTCPLPSISINTETAGTIEVTLESQDVYQTLEAEYGSKGYLPGTGNTITITSTSTQITGFTTGTYDMYVRGYCTNGNLSSWVGPKSFHVTTNTVNTCNKPTNLELEYYLYEYVLSWDSSYHESTIEYGITGFQHGDGTEVTVYSTSFYSKGVFEQGLTYDFYVKAKCNNGLSSEWSAVKTFTANNNANTCLPPKDLVATRNGSDIQFSFNGNGENKYQVSLQSSSAIPTTNIQDTYTDAGTFSGVPSNTLYFFARSICEDGSKTAWSGPITIN